MANNGNEQLETQAVEKQKVETKEGVEKVRSDKAYMPRTDIYETDDAMIIVADMPGVDEKSVDITLEKNILGISGFVALHAPDNHNLTYTEYDAGNYKRSFTLSDSIDQDNIAATVQSGVLTVTLPKAGPAKARKIDVQSA